MLVTDAIARSPFPTGTALCCCRICIFDLCSSDCAPFWRDFKTIDEEDDSVEGSNAWWDLQERELGSHVGDLDGTDSEDEFDRMTPITTILCEIGWNFNELMQAVASHRYHSNAPAGGSVAGPAIQGLKKAKRKEKMRPRRRRSTGFNPCPRPPPALTLALLTNALCTLKHP
jgi:hypothetical protein